MNIQQTLSNAPITEAVFDIRVELDKSFNYEDLEKIHEKIKDNYPTKEVSNKWEGFIEVKMGQEPISQSTSAPNGFLFKNADGSKIFQARLDGFTFNKLKPYTNWEDFQSEAKHLWEIYQEIAQPIQITRLAIRYINTINIPLVAELKDYFTYIPNVPEETPIKEFATRLLLEDPNKHTNVNIILASDQSKNNEESKTILVDLDIFRHVNNPDNDTIFQIAEELRVCKNKTFFDLVTEQALKPYV